jgi:hypothetical protein
LRPVFPNFIRILPTIANEAVDLMHNYTRFTYFPMLKTIEIAP